MRHALGPGEARTIELALAPEPQPGAGDAWIWGPIAGIGAAVGIAVAIAVGGAVNDGSQLTPRTDVVLRP